MREIEAQEMTTYVTWVMLVVDVFPFQTNDDLQTLPVLCPQQWRTTIVNNKGIEKLRAFKVEGNIGIKLKGHLKADVCRHGTGPSGSKTMMLKIIVALELLSYCSSCCSYHVCTVLSSCTVYICHYGQIHSARITRQLHYAMWLLVSTVHPVHTVYIITSYDSMYLHIITTSQIRQLMSLHYINWMVFIVNCRITILDSTDHETSARTG